MQIFDLPPQVREVGAVVDQVVGGGAPRCPAGLGGHDGEDFGARHAAAACFPSTRATAPRPLRGSFPRSHPEGACHEERGSAAR